MNAGTSTASYVRRTSTAVLIVAIGLVALSAAQAFYQTMLATDSWKHTEGVTVDAFWARDLLREPARPTLADSARRSAAGREELAEPDQVAGSRAAQ